jgi:hypothetical protein
MVIADGSSGYVQSKMVVVTSSNKRKWTCSISSLLKVISSRIVFSSGGKKSPVIPQVLVCYDCFFVSVFI